MISSYFDKNLHISGEGLRVFIEFIKFSKFAIYTPVNIFFKCSPANESSFNLILSTHSELKMPQAQIILS